MKYTVVTLTGIISRKSTKDGIGYILTTNDGEFSLTGIITKSISVYLDTVKPVTVVGRIVLERKEMEVTRFLNKMKSCRSAWQLRKKWPTLLWVFLHSSK